LSENSARAGKAGAEIEHHGHAHQARAITEKPRLAFGRANAGTPLPGWRGSHLEGWRSKGGAVAKPNWAIWDTLQELTTDDWAYLWNDLEPSKDWGSRTAGVLHVMNMLYEAASSGRLRARDSSYSMEYESERSERVRSFYVPGDTYVKRKDLKAWCEANGYRPKCLFTEERPGEIKKTPFEWLGKRESDSWTPALRDCARSFHSELGFMPNVHQLWARMIEEPPTGYRIKYDEETDTLTMPGEARLTKSEASERLKKFTKP